MRSIALFRKTFDQIRFEGDRPARLKLSPSSVILVKKEQPCSQIIFVLGGPVGRDIPGLLMLGPCF